MKRATLGPEGSSEHQSMLFGQRRRCTDRQRLRLEKSQHALLRHGHPRGEPVARSLAIG